MKEARKKGAKRSRVIGKIMKIRTFVIFFIFCMQFSSAGIASDGKVQNAPSPAAPRALGIGKETEYEESKVMLIDHEAGLLGVVWKNNKTGKEEKRSFKVDPKVIYVTNMQAHELKFSDINVGDSVDIYTKPGQDGKEEVTDIWVLQLTPRGDE